MVNEAEKRRDVSANQDTWTLPTSSRGWERDWGQVHIHLSKDSALGKA